MIEDLLIVIVLYKIRLEDSLTFKTVLNSLGTVNNQLSIYIYDNSPESKQDDMLYEGLDIKYLKDYNNAGISKAYNAAADYGRSKNKKWLLLLDQDSDLPIDFFSSINNSISVYPQESLFVPVLKQDGLILSPCRFRFMKGSALKKIEKGIFSLKGHSVFNSGIIIRLSKFYEVGGYNEDIPLDFSDHSFIHRFKKHNKNLVVMPIVVEHQLSGLSNDKDIIFRRFKQYCFGVKKYGETDGGKGWLFFWTLLRAIKLTVKFKEVNFLSEFLKTQTKL